MCFFKVISRLKTSRCCQEYRRNNGLKVGMREASRVLQCSINSVRKYWLPEEEYPIHEAPEEGWKYNRFGDIERIEELGPLDDDSDFFTSEMHENMPDFLKEAFEVRQFVKKKQKPKVPALTEYPDPKIFPKYVSQKNDLKPAQVRKYYASYYEKALELVKRYDKNKKSEPLYKNKVSLEERYAIGKVRKKRKGADIYVQALVDTINHDLSSKERLKEFKKRTKWWLVEDSSYAEEYHADKTRVVISSEEQKSDDEYRFQVVFHLNARNEKGEWLHRLQDIDEAEFFFEKGIRFLAFGHDHFYFYIHFIYKKSGELIVDKEATENEKRRSRGFAEYVDFFDFYKPKQDEEVYGGLTQPHYQYALDKYRKDDILEMLKAYLQTQFQGKYTRLEALKEFFDEVPFVPSQIDIINKEEAYYYLHPDDKFKTWPTFVFRCLPKSGKLTNQTVKKIEVSRKQDGTFEFKNETYKDLVDLEVVDLLFRNGSYLRNFFIKKYINSITERSYISQNRHESTPENFWVRYYMNVPCKVNNQWWPTGTRALSRKKYEHYGQLNDNTLVIYLNFDVSPSGKITINPEKTETEGITKGIATRLKQYKECLYGSEYRYERENSWTDIFDDNLDMDLIKKLYDEFIENQPESNDDVSEFDTMPDFLQEGYVPPVKTEETEELTQETKITPEEDDLYADRPFGPMPKHLRKRTVSDEEYDKFKAELREWAKEDDDSLKTYLKELSHVPTMQGLKKLNSTFAVHYYLNMRKADGSWYFRLKEMDRRMDAFLDGEEYNDVPERIHYEARRIFITLLPNGEFEIDKRATFTEARSVNSNLGELRYMSHYKPLSENEKAILKSKKKLDDEAIELIFKTDWFAYLQDNIDWDLIREIHAKAVDEVMEMKRQHEETEAAKAEDLRQQRERIKKEAILSREAEQYLDKRDGPASIPVKLLKKVDNSTIHNLKIRQKAVLHDWLQEDDDRHLVFKKELTCVQKNGCSDRFFSVKYYLNMRKPDGGWLYHSQQLGHAFECLEMRKTFKEKDVKYIAPVVKFEILKDGSLKFLNANVSNQKQSNYLTQFMKSYAYIEDRATRTLYENGSLPKDEQKKMRWATGWGKYLVENLDMDLINRLYEESGYKKPVKKEEKSEYPNKWTRDDDFYAETGPYIFQEERGVPFEDQIERLHKWVKEDDENLKDAMQTSVYMYGESSPKLYEEKRESFLVSYKTDFRHPDGDWLQRDFEREKLLNHIGTGLTGRHIRRSFDLHFIVLKNGEFEFDPNNEALQMQSHSGMINDKFRQHLIENFSEVVDMDLIKKKYHDVMMEHDPDYPKYLEKLKKKKKK